MHACGRVLSEPFLLSCQLRGVVTIATIWICPSTNQLLPVLRDDTLQEPWLNIPLTKIRLPDCPTEWLRCDGNSFCWCCRNCCDKAAPHLLFCTTKTSSSTQLLRHFSVSWVFSWIEKGWYLVSQLLPISSLPPTGLPENCTVKTPAFTDAVRLHRQARGQYGTWDMMCGTAPQVNHK